ncbi:MAG: prepilin peptidase [Candidatus Aminicenantes bacterium]|nr:prepilin peptidase [Candidatus Aminicenantes bacterium]
MVETLRIIFIVIVGLVWGSFLNVVIYRLPRGLSIVRPPSSCPNCGQRIKWYDNIPVLSYILLGGKCRFCRAKISIVYPLVEVLTAACFVLVYFHNLKFFDLQFFADCLFVSSLIAIGFIDYFHQIIPGSIALPFLIIALAYSPFRYDLNPAQSIFGAAAGGGFLLLVYFLYFLWRKKEGLGLGDVMMMLMVGAYLGLARTIFTLLLASVVGAVFGLLLMGFRKKNLQFALPFGTFIAPAAFVALIWGERLITWYLTLFHR